MRRQVLAPVCLYLISLLFCCPLQPYQGTLIDHTSSALRLCLATIACQPLSLSLSPSRSLPSLVVVPSRPRPAQSLVLQLYRNLAMSHMSYATRAKSRSRILDNSRRWTVKLHFVRKFSHQQLSSMQCRSSQRSRPSCCQPFLPTAHPRAAHKHRSCSTLAQTARQALQTLQPL